MSDAILKRIQRWRASEQTIIPLAESFASMFKGEPVRVLVIDGVDAKACGYNAVAAGSTDKSETERKRWLTSLTEAFAAARVLPEDAACCGMRELMNSKKAFYMVIGFAVPDWPPYGSADAGTVTGSMRSFATHLIEPANAENVWLTIKDQIPALMEMEQMGGQTTLRRCIVEPSASGNRLKVTHPAHVTTKKRKKDQDLQE